MDSLQNRSKYRKKSTEPNSSITRTQTTQPTTSENTNINKKTKINKKEWFRKWFCFRASRRKI